MAHNINHNAITGKDAFFSVQQKAWHGLGTIVTDYPTSAEAIEFAGLNFEVEKRTIYTELDESQQPIKSHFATVRADTNQILGVVGNRYTIVQNREAFTFFDSIVGGGDGIQYETAGALGNGERIFITAKLPHYIKVASDDLIEQYIFLTTSHDGSGSIQAAFTPVRIVCNNTLTAALRNCSNMVTIRHTVSAHDELKTAHRVMGISYQLSQQLEPIFKTMAKTYITDDETRRLISLAMAPSDVVFQAIRDRRTDVEFSTQFQNIVGEVYEYAMAAPTQQMNTTKGTMFGVYNAITGYYQNAKEFKSLDHKTESILFGTGADRSKKAFDLCLNASDYLS
jgi:phage/plasmid-like protein (TIGR03299 family)